MHTYICIATNIYFECISNKHIQHTNVYIIYMCLCIRIPWSWSHRWARNFSESSAEPQSNEHSKVNLTKRNNANWLHWSIDFSDYCPNTKKQSKNNNKSSQKTCCGGVSKKCWVEAFSVNVWRLWCSELRCSKRGRNTSLSSSFVVIR